MEADWERSTSQWYKILGYFQVESVIEMSKPPSLLDLACGDGLLTSQMAEHFSRVIGIDAVKRSCPGIEFHTSLIEKFETSERFSTITMLNILEHVIDPAEVLRRASGWLAPGGRIIVQVPNALAINRRIGQLMGVIDNLYELSEFDVKVAGHRHYFDMARLATDFERAGLTIVATGGIFFKILSTPQMEWLLEEGRWGSGEFGWGELDAFCRACYEIGKDRPEDCNIIYVCGEL